MLLWRGEGRERGKNGVPRSLRYREFIPIRINFAADIWGPILDQQPSSSQPLLEILKLWEWRPTQFCGVQQTLGGSTNGPGRLGSSWGQVSHWLQSWLYLVERRGKERSPISMLLGVCPSPLSHSTSWWVISFSTGEMSQFKPDSSLYKQVCQASSPGPRKEARRSHRG